MRSKVSSASFVRKLITKKLLQCTGSYAYVLCTKLHVLLPSKMATLCVACKKIMTMNNNTLGCTLSSMQMTLATVASYCIILEKFTVGKFNFQVKKFMMPFTQ